MADLFDIRYQPWNGSAQATITLPALTGFKGQSWFVHNKGTANVIVAAAGADNIFTNQTGTQDYIPPGSWALFVNDGVYWSVLNGMNGGQTTQEQFTTLTSPYTLASQTAAQKLFNASTNGQVTLLPGTYFFDCMFTLSSMSASSGSFGFALGATNSLVIGSQLWQTEANKATLATAAGAQNTVNTAANTAIATATTATVGWAHVWGKLRVTTAGTLVPQVSLGVSAAAVVGTDSYFRLWTAGLAATTNIGIWG